MKVGQITAFIILGLVILAGILLIPYYLKSAPAASVQQPAEFPEVFMLVQECMDQTAKDAVIYISGEGGYYDNVSVSIFNFPIKGENYPVYVGPGQYNVPELTSIQDSLARYVEDNMASCTRNFTMFRDMGIDVEAGSPKASALITFSQVIFEVDYRITARQGSNAKEKDKFSSAVDTDLMDMYDAAKSFSEIQKEDPGSFAMSGLMDAASERGMTFIIHPFEGADVITLMKNDSKGEQHNFTFALKYHEANPEVHV